MTGFLESLRPGVVWLLEVTTIPVLVYEVDLNMSLVTIHATKMWSWGFYDATITAL